MAVPRLSRAISRANHVAGGVAAGALPDLRESRSEANRGGSSGDVVCVCVAVYEVAGIPLRAVPIQIFFDPATKGGQRERSRAVDVGGVGRKLRKLEKAEVGRKNPPFFVFRGAP